MIVRSIAVVFHAVDSLIMGWKLSKNGGVVWERAPVDRVIHDIDQPITLYSDLSVEADRLVVYAKWPDYPFTVKLEGEPPFEVELPIQWQTEQEFSYDLPATPPPPPEPPAWMQMIMPMMMMVMVGVVMSKMFREE